MTLVSGCALTQKCICPVIARKQIAKGAGGVCAAKLGEAEVMCAAGVDDVLITSPLASTDKLELFYRTAI